MKKIIIILIAIISILALGAIAFYFWPKPVNVTPLPEIKSNVYQNDTYGFTLIFPPDWKGYTVIKGNWTGNLLKEPGMAVGPMITFRNPNWKETDHWQDIPIMMFTNEAWKLIENEEISLGAAPIGPSEIGRNSKYIFATPARWYGFTSDKGQEEAVAIVKNFKVNDPFKK
jgi:hypothetical protein